MTTDQVDVHKAARDLADALEGDWRVFPGHWFDRDAFVRLGAEAGLHVHQIRGTNRLEISGEYGVGSEEDLYDSWPRTNYAATRHEITVSAAKTGAQIAGDVKRRLLPNYREALAKARATRAAWDEREAAEAALLEKLVGILGGRTIDHRPGTIRVGSYGDSSPHGEVRVSGNDVEFELRVPAELAVDFATRVAATS